MSRNEVRVIVLFEDDAHETFLRRLVSKLRLRPERFIRCRDCNGVLEQFRLEIDALQRKKHQKNLKLVITIDADHDSRSKRLHQLEEILGRKRDDDDRIAFVIPAWEIETWYVHLCCPEARPIDESRKDYKSDPAWRQLARDLGSAAKRAVEAWLPESGRDDPDSLVMAREELDRLR